MRAIGFQAGQRGDLILGTVAARAFKQQYPDAKLTFGLHKQYEDMIPLFSNHPHYSDYHLWHEYANWPGGEDNLFLAKNQFDMVYHAMPRRHNESNWWQTESQAQNICSIYNLPIPTNLQCHLNQWFDVPNNKDYIALAAVGGWQDYPNKKSFSHKRAEEIVQLIKQLGYNTMQLGGPDEPIFEGAEKSNLNYFDLTKEMLGCKMLLTVDTGRSWLASAYSFPTLGCYSNGYYGCKYISSIQPINNNAYYLDAETVDQIPLEEIAAKIKEMT